MKSTTARLAAASLLIVAGAGVAPAERGDFNNPHDPYVAAVGLAVGYTSGTGLAVRWPALPQVMAMATGGIWGRKGDVAWNTGFELHYVLRQSGSARVHVGPGVAIFSDGNDENSDVNVALGIGGEILFWRRTAIKLDLGFTYLGDEGDILPLPQVAVLFYF